MLPTLTLLLLVLEGLLEALAASFKGNSLYKKVMHRGAQLLGLFMIDIGDNTI
jgi:hypothetical protein